MLSRRTVLVAAAGLATGGCARASGVAHGVSVETHEFVSAARGGRTTRWTLMRPRGAGGTLPVVVALHGLGGDHGYVPAIGGAAALAAAGTPFALVAPDGGTSYWHPHDGEDAGAMVTDELLPRLADHDLRSDRIALIGWSMGGYGALRLAGLLGPSRVAGVAAVSPALWTDPASASHSGFDDAADYRRYSVMGDQRKLDGIPVRVDCGRSDPFADAVRSYRSGFAHRPGGGFSFGSHDRGYWRRVLPAELTFLGGTLAA
ncbi:alpha/beta fold hydrolase [Nocardioides sp. CER19]|uniref:alpha/beta hydrolase n=1 Tax=Nocardioides sp. CER19 TaxID=3038538 RepID=UPI002449CF51|nr:alpha/beta fold hydrolase [Nocardioides sp. CER19]MDH2415900.1 alpha/beta fold hydrolase [Nocardioides sp. CER19]